MHLHRSPQKGRNGIGAPGHRIERIFFLAPPTKHSLHSMPCTNTKHTPTYHNFRHWCWKLYLSNELMITSPCGMVSAARTEREAKYIVSIHHLWNSMKRVVFAITLKQGKNRTGNINLAAVVGKISSLMGNPGFFGM